MPITNAHGTTIPHKHKGSSPSQRTGVNQALISASSLSLSLSALPLLSHRQGPYERSPSQVVVASTSERSPNLSASSMWAVYSLLHVSSVVLLPLGEVANLCLPFNTLQLVGSKPTSQAGNTNTHSLAANWSTCKDTIALLGRKVFTVLCVWACVCV